MSTRYIDYLIEYVADFDDPVSQMTARLNVSMDRPLREALLDLAHHPHCIESAKRAKARGYECVSDLAQRFSGIVDTSEPRDAQAIHRTAMRLQRDKDSCGHVPADHVIALRLIKDGGSGTRDNVRAVRHAIG
jgi:hypothetical protein